MLDTIKSFIETELLSGREIDSGENLLLSGLVDSLGVMRLVAFIEVKFGLKVPAADIKLVNFATLDAIVAYVGARAEQ
ncbi:MAG: acyl carrier protein [Alphaproteobacteria bacterium]|nr:acyl carrier protein [Alphaproteobacteria bacterium]